MLDTDLTREIKRRRTFAIISHPDAGKTTITEKLLLYGGAIQLAGSVKAKKGRKFATSDWMELEKQRGISVTSSVMKFAYKGTEINLIDTPGHQDFSEDTYRTLTAVDSALMLIDAAGGVEAQTIKLFKVCAMQKTPVIAMINKMDREGKSPFDLIDEIEKVLGISCYPMTWPIGMGDRFRGVYRRDLHQLLIFEKGSDKGRPVALDHQLSADSVELKRILGEEQATQLLEEIDLLNMAGDSFDLEKYKRGELAPVYFGSALNNFGVETLLDALIELAPYPTPRATSTRMVDAFEEKFTGFIFKIQANMDPDHRDRVAFMRLCSGKFSRNMRAYHVRSGKWQRLGRPTQFMAQDRSLVDEAYAGDIVGIHDPGIFAIGDSLTEGENLQFTGIPVFAPEHFMRVELKDPLKSKQLNKALDQLSEEGAVQVFRPLDGNSQYLGVVGPLQFDVVKFRIKAEYNVEVQMSSLPFEMARWLHCQDGKKLDHFISNNRHKIFLDQHDKPALLLEREWQLKIYREDYPDIEFFATSQNLVSK